MYYNNNIVQQYSEFMMNDFTVNVYIQSKHFVPYLYKLALVYLRYKWMVYAVMFGAL